MFRHVRRATFETGLSLLQMQYLANSMNFLPVKLGKIGLYYTHTVNEFKLSHSHRISFALIAFRRLRRHLLGDIFVGDPEEDKFNAISYIPRMS
jgi:hypothetical protein